MRGDRHNDVFGRKVAAIGDLDGDGRADLLVGARNNDNHGIDAGMARVFLLGPTPTPHLGGACGEGSVGIGVGGPFRLLRANGDSGWIVRRVTVAQTASVTLQLDQPPSNPQPSLSFVFAFAGVPTPQAATPLPLGIGTICFPPTSLSAVTSGSLQLTIPPLRMPVRVTIQAVVEEAAGVWRVAKGESHGFELQVEESRRA